MWDKTAQAHCNSIQTRCSAIRTLLQLNSNNSSGRFPLPIVMPASCHKPDAKGRLWKFKLTHYLLPYSVRFCALMFSMGGAMNNAIRTAAVLGILILLLLASVGCASQKSVDDLSKQLAE